MGESVQVSILEDNRIVRDAIAALLKRSARIKVVGLRSLSAACSATRERSDPWVVVITSDSVSANTPFLARVCESYPGAGIVMVCRMASAHHLPRLIAARVQGFITSDSAPSTYVSTILAVAAGDCVLPAALTQTLFNQIRAAAHGDEDRIPCVRRLTRREAEIARLVAMGKSNRAIAASLSIAVHTVKSHLHNMLEKLGVRTRSQIAVHSLNNPTEYEPAQRMA